MGVGACSTLCSRDELLNTDSPAHVSSSMCLLLIVLYVLHVLALKTVSIPLVVSAKHGGSVRVCISVCGDVTAGVCTGVDVGECTGKE